MSKIHKYEMLVLERHLDSFGHMNNATYFEILEEARWDMIEGRGYGYREVHELQIGPTILEAKIRFKKELKLREKVVIETRLLSYVKVYGTLEQIIKNSKGEACTEVEFLVGLFDMKARKLIPPTQLWKKALGLTGSGRSSRKA